MSCFSFVSSLFGGGERINGQSYSVVRRIGEGGFSYVDLVHRDGHSYALKRILIQLPEQREAAQNEIRAHTQVDHPNVVHLVDSEIRDVSQRTSNCIGIAFLLFPYYQNGTLQDLMEYVHNVGVPLEERRIGQLFLSVCQGLKALHNCQGGPIAHRDIKPGNLLLSHTGKELVVMDLGSTAPAQCVISNRREALALQEHCAQTCTAHYRAPELFEVPSNCTITAKTDVWSLGCSLYAAAFGNSPCDGSALSAMSGRITFPREHSYSEEFCELVVCVLSVDPDSRPSVTEVEDRLTTLLQQVEEED
ncbi:probable serine/threonine-protein kinase DDB_G0291350 [Halichondria panicea]|uniref:probable serine/threonine-protein kinase DDB_G0291350 n=1 Tax=Halichondria panicea TaxID=6063 RepID=UPI00312B7A25